MPGHPQHAFHIQIDRGHFEVTQTEMTGAALRALETPPIPADRDLYEVRPGHEDLLIGDSDGVKIADGQRFFTAPGRINPGSR